MGEQRNKLSNSFWVGAIILGIGSFLLLDKLDLLDFPRWLFSWKVFLIVVGVVIGVNRRFEGIGWLALILVGSFFLLEDIFFDWDLRRYFLPIAIIAVGLIILTRAVAGSGVREARKSAMNSDGIVATDEGGDDYFDLVAVFGAIKRKVFSKMFRGGKVSSVFSGVDIDLSQADMNGTVLIDVVCIFGGIKLIVPSNWETKNDVTAIMGGVEDKRTSLGTTLTKKIVLTGFVMFGGVDIKSYV
ncbi:MAG: LiaF transmembrane domain-containing protein [Cyclobacteriaceae bacterium]|jgi:predicted membrane protein|nr:cell wall-active antibiotics response protein [Flammeovirgaceae bacterium]